MRNVLTLIVLSAVCASASANVDDFLADSNQFGYQGTVTNVTKGLPAVAFPTPRDAVVYFTNNVPLAGYAEWGNYSQIQSNWYQHSTSNQNPGFFQIADYTDQTPSTLSTVTSATGGWTQNGDLWDFALTVAGVDATAPIANSRLWQPDAGHAWGGTYTSYTYTISATGMETEIIDGWRYSTTDPAGITGSFDGTFVSTQLVYKGEMVPDGDTFTVHLDFDKAYWTSDNWSDTYQGYEYGQYSMFGAPIPEPATMSLLGLGAIALLKRSRK